MTLLPEHNFQVIPLDQAFKAKWNQAKKDGDTVAGSRALGSAIENTSTKLIGVSARTKGNNRLG